VVFSPDLKELSDSSGLQFSGSLSQICGVFSIVVFSCIVNEGYINIGSERLLCVFNKNAHACNYGMTVGVACFLGSTCFLILDVYFPSMSNLKDRKRAVLFLWFVGFCFLANQWKATSPDELPLAQGSDAARAIITFCFFSILSWVFSQIKISLNKCMIIYSIYCLTVEDVCHLSPIVGDNSLPFSASKSM
uniref:MARVEL domain-containing protein n=1 Tax=Xiphophorus couchianus TaxID=32473 RepID=A0A3B5L9S2_9TELE